MTCSLIVSCTHPVRPVGRSVLSGRTCVPNRIRQQGSREQRVSCVCVCERESDLVWNYRTAIAIRAKDGVVLGVEKLITSKLHERSVNCRINTIDQHVGMVCE